MESATWTSAHQSQPGYDHAECPMCQQQRPTLMRHHSPRVVNQLPDDRLITLICFNYGRGRVLFLMEQTFWIQICLPYTPVFYENYHPGTYRTPYPPLQYAMQHCFQSRNSFHGKWNETMGSCSQNPLVLPYFPPSQRSQLDRTVKCPLEDSVIAPTKWQYLARLGQGSPEGCICSELVANQYMMFLPQPGFMDPGGGITIIPLVTHQQNFCFLFL